MCFLSILQSQASILHVLTSHLQRPVLTSEGMHREPALGCQGVDEACRVFGLSMGQLLYPQKWHHQWIVCGFPDGVHEVVSRICVPLLCCILSPGCHSFSPSLTLYCTVHDSIQGRNGPLWQHPEQLGKSGCLLICSHFFPWEKSWTKKISLGTELCRLGGKVKLFLLPSSMNPISDFFFPSNNVLELLNWTSRLPQRHSHPWVVVKIGVL